LGFGLWVAWGKGWPVEGEHRRPAAPAAAAGKAGDVDPRLRLLGGRRAAVELEEGAGASIGNGSGWGGGAPVAAFQAR
jgi:hypothetical protein